MKETMGISLSMRSVLRRRNLFAPIAILEICSTWLFIFDFVGKCGIKRIIVADKTFSCLAFPRESAESLKRILYSPIGLGK